MTTKFDEDFAAFVSDTDLQQTPSHLDHMVLQRIKNDLEPSKIVIFSKLIIMQAFVGIITMLFCPQFDMSLTSNEELFHFFHQTFGIYGCMVACGVLFIGSGALFASQILRYSELSVVSRSKFLFSFSVVGSAILGFIFVGADIYFDLTLAWAAGGLFSQLLAIESNFFIRSLLRRKATVN